MKNRLFNSSTGLTYGLKCYRPSMIYFKRTAVKWGLITQLFRSIPETTLSAADLKVSKGRSLNIEQYDSTTRQIISVLENYPLLSGCLYYIFRRALIVSIHSFTS